MNPGNRPARLDAARQVCKRLHAVTSRRLKHTSGGEPMTKRWLKLAAVPIALSFVAASCGSSDGDSGSSDTTPAGTEAPAGTTASGDGTDFGGATVTITGPERDDPSIASLNDDARCIRRVGEHQRRVHRRRRLGSEHQHAGPGRQSAEHLVLPAARQARRLRSCRQRHAADRRGQRHGRRVLDRRLPAVRQRRWRPVRRPGQDRPQVARVVPARSVRGSRLRSSHDVRRVHGA